MMSAITLSSILLLVSIGSLGFTNADTPRSVRVELVKFKYTPDSETCDIKIPFGGQASECDSRFEITYRSGKNNKIKQTIPEMRDENSVTFGHLLPVVLDGPFTAGSRISVEVEVTDIDITYHSEIANFYFEYTVPDTLEEEKEITKRDNWRRWYSKMTVRFVPIW